MSPLALTDYQIGLLASAFVFIGFALTAALVVPRVRPGFPGKQLWIFLVVVALLFIGQLTAVLLVANHEEAEPAAAETGTSTTGTTGTTETTTAETTPTETTAGKGDPVAGKAVFTSAGCVSCHTLADARATGTVGPNLDAVKPSYDKVVVQVTNGGSVMPPFKDTLSEQQIQDVAAYVSSVAGS